MQKRVAWKQRAGAAGRNHVCPFHLQEYGTEKERYGRV